MLGFLRRPRHQSCHTTPLQSPCTSPIVTSKDLGFLRHCDSATSSNATPATMGTPHSNSVSGSGGTSAISSSAAGRVYNNNNHHGQYTHQHHHSVSHPNSNMNNHQQQQQQQHHLPHQTSTGGSNTPAENDNISIGSTNSSNINQQIRSRINSFKNTMFQTPRFYRRKIMSNIIGFLWLFVLLLLFSHRSISFFVLVCSAGEGGQRVAEHGVQVVVSTLEFQTGEHQQPERTGKRERVHVCHQRSTTEQCQSRSYSRLLIG